MADLILNNIGKAYNDKKVLEKCSYSFKQGGVYCIMGASGAGKTTLFNIMLGLEKPDCGGITGNLKKSAAFQDDRLIEDMTAVENVLFVFKKIHSRQKVFDELGLLLDKDALNKPVKSLSTGMRRRVGIVRAMLAESDIVFLDEPFAGLDVDARKRATDYILDRRNGRTLLIITHDYADVTALQAEILTLTTSDTVATILRK